MSDVVKPTIYDVAREAGVAPSTVSRAFARPGRVNAETAQRIRDVAERLGYRTGPVAAAARVRENTGHRVLALVVPDARNPFYAHVQRSVQVAAQRAGYMVLVTDAQESGEGERAAVERLLPFVDGLALAGSRLPDAAIRHVARQKPVVVLNRVTLDVPSVVPDNAAGALKVLEHLAGLGHTTVEYLSGPVASWTEGARWQALQSCSTDAGLRVHRLGPFTPDVAGGVLAAAELARRRPTAVVAYNDQMAIGVLKGLVSQGIRVPEQISVVGFDNIESAELITPALTTVACPIGALGTAAVQSLTALVEGQEQRVRPRLVLPVRLVTRASTAQRRRKRISPAWGTTRVSPSASNAVRSMEAGSR